MGCVGLAIDVDDILLMGSDSGGIEAKKIFLYHHFVTRDLLPSRDFLGIEFAYCSGHIALC